MTCKDRLLRRYSAWFNWVCSSGQNPDVVKRENIKRHIVLQRALRGLDMGVRFYDWRD